MGSMMIQKRYVCANFALSNTHLKMYGKGTHIDKVRECASIDTSFEIWGLNLVIAFRF